MKRGAIAWIMIAIFLVILLLVLSVTFYNDFAICGVENCNGPQFTCGSKIPVVCIPVAQFGDSCRDYANCQKINGSCVLVKNETYDQCLDCMSNCSKQYLDNEMGLLRCEERCGY